MTNNTDNEYALCRKKVWGIYALIVVAIIIVLVALVASDNEERLFFSLMTVAASYVFRPTDRVINKYVLRLFGVSPPEKPVKESSEESTKKTAEEPSDKSPEGSPEETDVNK